MKRIWNKEIPRAWVRASLLAAAASFFALLGFCLAWLNHLARDLPPLAAIQAIEPSRGTMVFAANGDTLHAFYRENRTVVPLARIPLRLQQAVVATEDRRFYEHYGIDARRLVKIIWINLTSRNRPGASTLTQQLARNLFLTAEKTLARKVREAILALQIEQTYAKDEILTMYLNQIYFGKGAYGVQAASRTFFGKDVWDLDDAEMTLLAGIIQNPGRYSPFTHLDAAYRRREAVLKSMVDARFLTRAEATEIAAQEVSVRDPRDSREELDHAAYFVEEVRQYLERRYGAEALYEGGLRVTTTLVPAYQRHLEEAAEKHMRKCERDFRFPMTRERYEQLALEERPPETPTYLQCAALLVDNRSGAVLAMLGGRSFHDSKFNRARQARRQPGSVFKPFVYLTALQRGYTPASILMDSPVVIDTGAGLWQPRNFSGTFEGPITLRRALSRSINCPTARFYLDFGLAPVLETVRELGIRSELPRVPSLFLGAGELTLLEIVAAYAPLGNQGIYVAPRLVTRVETADGELLEESRPQQHEAVDPATAYVMASLLESTLREGTAARAAQLGFKGVAAGKTGTTNDYTDAWFVGFTPTLCAGVWVGFDAKISMGGRKTGAVMALPIWADFMGRITADQGSEAFSRPAGVTDALVCQESGNLATIRCQLTRAEVFLEGTAPRWPCELHRGPLRPLRPGDIAAPAAPVEPVEEGF